MTTAINATEDQPIRSGENRLLDHVAEKLGVKNDAALSRALGVAPPVVSKIRHDRLPVTARLMIKIHEVSDLSIREIKIYLGK